MVVKIRHVFEISTCNVSKFNLARHEIITELILAP